MDAFYASVEQRDNPALRGKPVIVGGSPKGRGVVSAASYEARKWGVHSAMPAHIAARKCPDAIFVRGDFKKYRDVSRRMRSIVARFTQLVEPLSLDECYLDVTNLPDGYLTATAVAVEIRSRIREELRLTASAGVAPYKYVAKIASDYNKPDGLTVVHPERLFDFLHPLPVQSLPGVGPAMLKKLNRMSIYNVGELAAFEFEELHAKLGKMGRRLWNMAHGVDQRRVQIHRRRKSRSAERTFAVDLHSRSDAFDEMARLVDRVSADIQKEQLLARTITIKIRYPDFTTITRSSTISRPTNNRETIREIAFMLLENTDLFKGVRLLGVGVGNLIFPDMPRQLNLDL